MCHEKSPLPTPRKALEIGSISVNNCSLYGGDTLYQMINDNPLELARLIHCSLR